MLPHIICINLPFNENPWSPTGLLLAHLRHGQHQGLPKVQHALGVAWGNAQTSDGCNQVDKNITTRTTTYQVHVKCHHVNLLFSTSSNCWIGLVNADPFRINTEVMSSQTNQHLSLLLQSHTLANRRFCFHWPLGWWNGEMWSISLPECDGDSGWHNTLNWCWYDWRIWGWR